VLEGSEFPVLHLSSVCLPKDATLSGKAYLHATLGKDLFNLTIACLQKDKIDS